MLDERKKNAIQTAMIMMMMMGEMLAEDEKHTVLRCYNL